MKVLVVLSLLGLAAASQQVVWPYSSLLTPTFRTAQQVYPQTPLINTYTATYPYAGVPQVRFAQSGFPSHYPLFSGVVQQETTSRQKRSAEPEPEADPALVYTTGITTPSFTTTGAVNYQTLATIPTSPIQYQYPAAVNSYIYPQQFAQPQQFTQAQQFAQPQQFTQAQQFTLPYTGFTSIAGNVPAYTAVSPYTTFPWFNPIGSSIEKVQATPAETPAKAEETSFVSRTKRSAEPEADPQLLTTGFTYPAVPTGTYQGQILSTPNQYTATIPATNAFYTAQNTPAYTTYTNNPIYTTFTGNPAYTSYNNFPFRLAYN